MDAVSPELVDRARATVLATPGVLSVPDLRLRWVGHRLQAEAEITVDPARTQIDAHAIAHEAHHALLHAIPRLDRVIVHASPAAVDGIEIHTATEHHEHPAPPAPLLTPATAGSPISGDSQGPSVRVRARAGKPGGRHE